jgi:GTP pyrophosphokinase
LKQQERIKSTALGKKMWEKKLEKYSPPSKELKPDRLLRNLNQVMSFNLKNIKDFYSQLGTGKIVLNKKLLDRLFAAKKPIGKKAPLFKRGLTKIKEEPESVGPGNSGNGRSIKIGKCCSPIRGESIVGYKTSEGSITVHTQGCTRVKNKNLDSRRIVHVSWDDLAEQSYQGNLLIKTMDSPGVLAKLTSIIAQLGGNITKANVKTTSEKRGEIKLSLIIQDINHLENIINKISDVEEIISIERT